MRWPWTRQESSDEADWSWPDTGNAVQASTETRFVGPGAYYDGSNFIDGVSGQVDTIENLDYWTLRQRSAAMFYGNLYARGIISRMVTDIINAGLSPESTPEEEILGLPEDSLADWAETVEKRWNLYGQSKEIVDYKGTREEGELQGQIYTESLICGDCLVIARIDEDTDLPKIQIVNGDRIQTPFEFGMDENVIDGVRVDADGKHVGYYVKNGTVDILNETFVYVPAVGKSGRRVSWMVYGPVKREDGIRGEPLLGVAIQPLKDISDYRGSTQLKAKLNAMIAMFIKRTNPVKTMPISAGAVRKESITGDSTGATAAVQLNKLEPGIVMQALEPGEEPYAYSTNGTDESFGAFEASIMVGVAWGLQIPPEILLMSFNKNYSASQAAKNKWNTYLAKERPRFASAHCKNHFEEWFTSSVLAGKIQAPGYLDTLADKRRHDERRAWLVTEWYGQIEPTVDPVKHVTSSKMAVAEGYSTRTREARQFNGSKFSHNVRRVAKENAQLAEAMRPMLELQNEFGQGAVQALLDQGPKLLASQLFTSEDEDDREIES